MTALFSRTISLSLAAWLPLVVAAMWCYFFYDVNLGIPPLAFRCMVLVVCAGWFYLFRQLFFRITVSGYDLMALAGLFVLNLVVHWYGLFLPIGGDELYHSSQSVAALRVLQHIADARPFMSPEDLRSSMSGMFDLRHLPVVDVWRIVAFSVLAVLAFFVFLYKKLTTPTARAVFVAVTSLALAFGGLYLAPGPEVHPPLRTLPLFISALVFGMTDFAFRLPAVVAITLAAWAAFLFLRSERANHSLASNLPMAVMTCFIPQVFYIAECVEPSVWGYLTYALVAILSLTVIRRGETEALIAAGVIAGLAIILRQSTVVLWLPVAVLFITRRKFWSIPVALRVFSPGIVALPYMISTKRIGHVAETAGKSNPIASVLESITTGIGPLSILNSTSIPWIAFFVFLIATVVRRAQLREFALFLWVIPAYSIFFTVWPYLWGIGRYQVEYVAPFILIAGLLHCLYAGAWSKKAATLALVPLALSTIEIHKNLSLDTSYLEWPKMRITTSAHFPYDEGVRFLKRQETFGRFVFVGGTPLNGDFFLWLHGMGFSDAKTWRELQDGFNSFLLSSPTQESVFKYVTDNRIAYVVVQGGSRREIQHRTPEISSVIGKLERVPLQEKVYFVKALTLLGEEGGTLTFYTPKVPK